MNIEELFQQQNTLLNHKIELQNVHLVIDPLGNCFLSPHPLHDNQFPTLLISLDCENLETLLESHDDLGAWLGGNFPYHDRIDIHATLGLGTTKRQPLKLTKISKLTLYRYNQIYKIL
ncbi:hypothetical protein SAMN05421749_11069 [Acinetobacter marinus]|uniref:Uncharacterized protein n=1 Tax=Acinetobacter marinus TaxID=281375 RepID=A0A1G6NQ21_9GAMM|nr:hypothetical protein [Acinetobacter marinus]SDC69808.1 hypothetical protein SAMN05421749_11069 [Acinetobacter marinus]